MQRECRHEDPQSKSGVLERLPAIPRQHIIAIAAVTEIALYGNTGGRPVSGHAVAARLHLSRRYLEATLQALARGGLLIGTRGARGGYELARHPAQITAADIMYALEKAESRQMKRGRSAVEINVTMALAQANRELLDALHHITILDLVQSVTEP
jgi:Rrf2 family transcriptional regulator, iron-sulfur cluster assembly transcription factor